MSKRKAIAQTGLNLFGEVVEDAETNDEPEVAYPSRRSPKDKGTFDFILRYDPNHPFNIGPAPSSEQMAALTDLYQRQLGRWATPPVKTVEQWEQAMRGGEYELRQMRALRGAA